MKTEQVLLPANQHILNILGENIKLARLRRKLSSEQVSQRASITRNTLYKIEHGSPSVSLGNYLQVLFVFGLQQDFTNLAFNDPLGRKLQDAGLLVPSRAPKNKN
jgi:transcriptional regulator with XRE-family HTH domain